MTEWISGNIFIRPNRGMKKGDIVHGHKHNFDHTTFVRRGAVHVKAVLQNGHKIEASFGDGFEHDHFLVKARVEHEIIALMDGTEFYCIYSHRTPQGEVSVAQTGWYDSYV